MNYREELASKITEAPNYNEEAYCNVIIHCPEGAHADRMGIIAFNINKSEYDRFFEAWIGFLRSENMLWLPEN